MKIQDYNKIEDFSQSQSFVSPFPLFDLTSRSGLCCSCSSFTSTFSSTCQEFILKLCVDPQPYLAEFSKGRPGNAERCV
ncbi:hypothetical protein L1887_22950 [Cichorium endivia]|nr:hypothetical protein L1887_22950 [Cichorium endivia]